MREDWTEECCETAGRSSNSLLCYLLSRVIFEKLSPLAWLALVCLPISLLSYIAGMRTHDNAYKFISTIRYMMIQYVTVLSILIISYIV